MGGTASESALSGRAWERVKQHSQQSTVHSPQSTMRTVQPESILQVVRAIDPALPFGIYFG
jgi:hypothetical protein